MLDLVGLRETLDLFVVELKRVNGQLVETNRKLDRIVELLGQQGGIQYDYSVTWPEGWLSGPGHYEHLESEEGE